MRSLPKRKLTGAIILRKTIYLAERTQHALSGNVAWHETVGGNFLILQPKNDDLI